MTEEQKKKIEQLVEQLNDANHRYYVLNDPVMSDYEFDMKLKELESLENETNYILPYSPTQRVGSDLQEDFKDVEREHVMGSIANVYDYDELSEWLNQFDSVDNSFLLEPKYDGTSCSLIYENGLLIQASTRGNGWKGSDITANVKTIKNIPLKLKVNNTGVTNDWHYEKIYVPSKIEIRGEILMPKSVFKKLNKERTEAGEQTFANERNAAAGSLKQLDPKVTASRGLIFKPYSILTDDKTFWDQYVKYQHCMLDIAEIFGFDEPAYWRCADANTVKVFVGEFENRWLNEQDYCMDGCVIKLESTKKQEEIGYTQKVPKWAKAFKFKQEQASTKLKSIDIQMGMSGQLSFVAVLDPVEVDGSTITNATLNNVDYIKRMDIHVGDYVFIQKNGAVIPGITGIDYERNEAENVVRVPFVEPDVCPFCGCKLVKKDVDGAHLYCSNKLCPERVVQKINHFAKKECMNIDGLSIKTIRKMNYLGLVNKWQDLYELTVEKLVYAGFGEKVSSNLIEQIQKSKELDGAHTLFALGIPMIGKITAKRLVSDFGSIKNVVKATVDDIYRTEGVGMAAAQSLISYIAENSDEIADVINILPTEAKAKSVNKPADKVVNNVVYSVANKQVDKKTATVQPLHTNQVTRMVATPVVEQNKKLADITSNVNQEKQEKTTFESEVKNEEPVVVSNESQIVGKRIMATGKLQNFTRESIIDSVEENGGIYASTISNNLDYLIVGEKAGAVKIQKAKSLNIEMINEDQYLKMIR